MDLPLNKTSGSLRALGPQYGQSSSKHPHPLDHPAIPGETNIFVASHSTPLMANLLPEVMFYCFHLPSAVASYDTHFPRDLYSMAKNEVPNPALISTAIKQPPLTLMKNFLTLDESQDLINQADNRLASVKQISEQYAQVAILRSYEFELLEKIDQRIAQLTGTNTNQGEDLYIYRFPANVPLAQHCDYIATDQENYNSLTSQQAGGQRIASLIICLNSIEQGGEIEFPVLGSILSAHHGNSCFIQYAYADGLEMAFDRRSLYAKRPANNQTQWLAVKYLRQSNIEELNYHPYPDVQVVG